ncbi:MAG: glutathione S-transferase N-terminal domain-containing protein [Pseudomonadota bacterium]
MYYLYGAQHSAYTGKARSYLIKQGIAFEERAFGHPRFMQEIIPATGQFMIPVMETEDGAFVQDTADIIDYFSSRGEERFPSRPQGAVASAISHLFDLFGGEGMLRAGMYYRWFFDDQNMAFIEDQFGLFMAPDMPADQRMELTRRQTGTMRKRAASLGVTDETGAVIEQSYLEFLDAFNSHLLDSPYLVGGAPTLGDYGMQVMFYAHLARDPYSATVMKREAQAVLRWTERLNQPGLCTPEYLNFSENCIADKEVPDTLKRMMRLVAQDYLPEIEASIGLHNAWLAENPVEIGMPVGGEKRRRIVGFIRFPLRGMEIECGARTYSLYMLQRLQDCVDGLDPVAQGLVHNVFQETGCEPFLKLRCHRRIDRADNKEVWGQSAQGTGG